MTRRPSASIAHPYTIIPAMQPILIMDAIEEPSSSVIGPDGSGEFSPKRIGMLGEDQPHAAPNPTATKR